MDKVKHFLFGYSSAFDMWGSSISVPDFSRGFERDHQALKGDWQRIGMDIKKGMNMVPLNGK
jgi:hypothetical protein